MEVSSVRVYWWALQLLFTAHLNFCKGQSLDGISRSGFPGLHEIAENGLHLYGLPIAERQFIQQYSVYVYEDRLYEHSSVNFTCSGNITKLMFVAWKGKLANDSTDTRETLWPRFSLLRFLYEIETRTYYRQLELLVSDHNPVPIHESGNVGIYEVVLSNNNSFEAGDSLGLWQPLYHNSSSRVALTVLHQSYGGYSYYDYSSIMRWNVVWEASDNFFPLVSIETGSNCAQGFLNYQSLEMIIKALQNNQTSNSLFFSRDDRQYVTPNTAFISNGILTKWTFAARFNHSNTKLPELQIWRKLSQNNFTKVHGISMEPRRTGYLNVFELDLSQAHEFEDIDIRAGDVFGVHQPQEDEARYSLAFLQSQDGPLTYVLPSLSNNSYSDVTLSSFTSTKMQPLVSATLGEALDSKVVSTESTVLENTSIDIVSGILSGACALLVLTLIAVMAILILVIIRHKRLIQNSSITVIARASDVIETQSILSETEETELLTHDNEAYNLDSQKTINPDHESAVTNVKRGDSESSSAEDLTGDQVIYDYIAAK